MPAAPLEAPEVPETATRKRSTCWPPAWGPLTRPQDREAETFPGPEPTPVSPTHSCPPRAAPGGPQRPGTATAAAFLRTRGSARSDPPAPTALQPRVSFPFPIRSPHPPLLSPRSAPRPCPGPTPRCLLSASLPAPSSLPRADLRHGPATSHPKPGLGGIPNARNQPAQDPRPVRPSARLPRGLRSSGARLCPLSRAPAPGNTLGCSPRPAGKRRPLSTGHGHGHGTIGSSCLCSNGPGARGRGRVRGQSAQREPSAAPGRCSHSSFPPGTSPDRLDLGGGESPQLSGPTRGAAPAAAAPRPGRAHEDATAPAHTLRLPGLRAAVLRRGQRFPRERRARGRRGGGCGAAGAARWAGPGRAPTRRTERHGARCGLPSPPLGALTDSLGAGPERVRGGPRSHSGPAGGWAGGRRPPGPAPRPRAPAPTHLASPPPPPPDPRTLPRQPLAGPAPGSAAPPPALLLARSRDPLGGHGGRGAPALHAPAPSTPRRRPPQPLPCGAVFTS